MRSLIGGALDAARRPRDSAPVPYSGRRSSGLAQLVNDRSDPEAQMRAMGAVGTLFAIVNRTSNATAQVDWDLWRPAASGDPEDRVKVVRHAALDVWRKPNPFMPRQEFVEVIQQHVDLTGEGWWVVGRHPAAPSIPLELWPVRPDRMTPVPDRENFIAGYVYTGPDGEKVPLALDEVIFLRMPNPLDPYRGMGPVQAILTDLDSSRYAKEWNRNFFVNSAEPGGIIEVEKRLSDEEFDEMTTRWGEQHRGVANAHRVAVIEQGKWVDRNITQRDMQFIEGIGVTRDAIREAFGIPKFAVGDIDDVNRATADASDRWFAKHLTTPRLERIKAALNNDFLPLFGPTAAGLEFDYVSPVGEDEELANAERDSKVAAVTALVNAGFDRAEVLAAVGLPDIAVGASGSGEATPRDVAEMVQKIYLGVGTVLTWEEARAVLVAAGADLDIAVPPPSAAVQAQPVLAPAARRLALSAGRRPRNAADPPDLDPDDLPDVTPLQDSWEQALDDLLADWEDISAAQKAALVKAVRKIARSGALTDLTGLTVDSGDAADALATAMAALAADAAAQVVDEAAEQDVTVKPREPAGLPDVATVVAASLAAGLVLSAVGAAIRANGPAATPDDVADAVEAALGELTDAEPRRQLGGALTGAQNAGRIETLRAAPEGALYANERNDQSTCIRCKEINGRWLGNTSDMDQVLASYPGGAYGGYIDCLGRERCRGTITGVWRPDQVGAPRPRPKPKPAPEPDRYDPARATERDAELADAVADITPRTPRERLLGGQTADTYVYTLPDGRRVVHKRGREEGDPDYPKWSADAEELAVRVADALGTPVARVLRDVADDAVWMEFVDGAVGDSDGSPADVLIGLLDAIIGNLDRQMIRADGGLVGIDHGDSWVPDELTGDGPPWLREPDGPMRHWVVRRGDESVWRSDLPYTAGELDALRRRVAAAGPGFAAAGRADWLDRTLATLDDLRRHARQTKGGS